MFKQSNKKTIKGTKLETAMIFIVIGLILTFISILIYDAIKDKKYECYVNNEFRISDNCYVRNGDAVCLVGNEITKVDFYYER